MNNQHTMSRRALLDAGVALGSAAGSSLLAQTAATRETAAGSYSKDTTALLIIDPYNDFMSEGGKLYKQTLETAKEAGFYENMRKLIPAVRAAGIGVFIVPHHRAVNGDYDNWLAVTSSQRGSARSMLFAAGTWGGDWHPEFGPKPGDVIIKEHWAQSGFANTDLDQQLKQHGIRKVILVGFIANTCVESTGRFAMEPGYHVTLVKDATAAFSKEGMTAAQVNAPTFAHAIKTTSELIQALPGKS